MQSSISYLRSRSAIGLGLEKDTVAGLAFILLFPGFFFYQTLLGIGKIPAFLGGYFSIVSLTLLIPLTFIYFNNVSRHSIYFSKVDLYFFIFLLYFFSVSVINYIAESNIIIVKHHLLSIIYLLDVFLIFKMTNFKERKFRSIEILSLISMSAIIFYFSANGMFHLEVLEESSNPESVATYQGFARSYFLTFIAIIAFVRSFPIRFAIYVMAVPALFVNGARSEFVALLILIPIIELHLSKHKLYIALVLILTLLVIAFNFESLLQSLPDNRILELANLSQSTSANSRHDFTMRALNTIFRHPIFGDFGSYPAGDYAHNILSAWVDLGLFGFIYLLIILIRPGLQLLSHGYFQKNMSGNFILAFALINVTLLFLFTSHFFSDMFLGAALGAYSNYQYERENRHE